MLIKKFGMLLLVLFLSSTSQKVKTSDDFVSAPIGFGTESGQETGARETFPSVGVHRTNGELAAELATLGLNLPDEFIEEMDSYNDYEEYKEWYDAYLISDPAFEYRMLLSCWGWGYDDGWNWIPTSDQVYSFDCEVFDLSSMYTDFMKGVIHISDGEFEITDLEERDDGVDYDKGTGIKVLSFRYNGTPYTYEAIFEGDWLDCGVIAFMNEVFEAEGNPKRLLATDDGGQGCILFYNTEEWGKELEAVTGLQVDTYFY